MVVKRHCLDSVMIGLGSLPRRKQHPNASQWKSFFAQFNFPILFTQFEFLKNVVTHRHH